MRSTNITTTPHKRQRRTLGRRIALATGMLSLAGGMAVVAPQAALAEDCAITAQLSVCQADTIPIHVTNDTTNTQIFSVVRGGIGSNQEVPRSTVVLDWGTTAAGAALTVSAAGNPAMTVVPVGASQCTATYTYSGVYHMSVLCY